MGEEGFEDATMPNRSETQQESGKEHEGHGCCCYVCFVLSYHVVVKKCEAFASQGGITGRKDEHEPVTETCDEKSKCDHIDMYNQMDRIGIQWLSLGGVRYKAPGSK